VIIRDHDTIQVHEEHPSGLCCLCDNPVFEYEEPGLCITHGVQYLAHADCIQGRWAEDEEADRSDDDDENDTGLASFNDTMS
jgi:hypothetical protein